MSDRIPWCLEKAHYQLPTDILSLYQHILLILVTKSSFRHCIFTHYIFTFTRYVCPFFIRMYTSLYIYNSQGLKNRSPTYLKALWKRNLVRWLTKVCRLRGESFFNPSKVTTQNQLPVSKLKNVVKCFFFVMNAMRLIARRPARIFPPPLEF